jgi:hypothetical protein
MRRRLSGLENFRSLTDTEAEMLLTDPALLVNEPVEWAVPQGQEDDPAGVCMTVRVFNGAGENLRVTARIALAVPHRSHWLLIWGDKRDQERAVCLRRLDLRDRHANPDGEAWDNATHKHTWSVAAGNDWAYTPDDIPHDQVAEPVGPDDYRAVFEAFLDECQIGRGPDYKWQDPPLAQRRQSTFWEVP